MRAFMNSESFSGVALSPRPAMMSEGSLMSAMAQRWSMSRIAEQQPI